MKQTPHLPRHFLTAIIAVFFIFTTSVQSHAEIVTPDMAKQVVQGWLNLDPTPLKAAMTTSVDRVVEYEDSGLPAYYIVHMNPRGLVIVSGDTEAEPIVGFLPEATVYVDSDDNPLGALVRGDLPARVAAARAGDVVKDKSGVKADQEAQLGTNPAKWDTLLQGMNKGLASGAMDDIRVDILVQSRWSQTTADGKYCYNAFTPYEMPSGCVATAMGQLMRFHQHPSDGIGSNNENYFVIGNATSNNTMGGNGAGGAYVWADMVLEPASGATQDQCDAIGRLLYDAGMTVGMDYGPSGSSADTLQSAVELRTTFGYSTSIRGTDGGGNIASATLKAMVNPNLDFGYPVLFGITGAVGGHAIVGDGYGYNAGTLYHHLNMGWAGSQDAWYNLPDIDSSPGPFNSVYKIVYNTFKTRTGEIVSGRVEDQSGNPISGVSISANSGAYTDTTDSNGIYALNVPSATALTISATKDGYTFTDISVSSETSTDGTTTVGNKWEQDFTDGGSGSIPTLNEWGMLIAALLLCAVFLLRRSRRRSRRVRT